MCKYMVFYPDIAHSARVGPAQSSHKVGATTAATVQAVAKLAFCIYILKFLKSDTNK